MLSIERTDLVDPTYPDLFNASRQLLDSNPKVASNGKWKEEMLASVTDENLVVWAAAAGERAERVHRHNEERRLYTRAMQGVDVAVNEALNPTKRVVGDSADTIVADIVEKILDDLKEEVGTSVREGRKRAFDAVSKCGGRLRYKRVRVTAANPEGALSDSMYEEAPTEDDDDSEN